MIKFGGEGKLKNELKNIALDYISIGVANGI